MFLILSQKDEECKPGKWLKGLNDSDIEGNCTCYVCTVLYCVVICIKSLFALKTASYYRTPCFHHSDIYALCTQMVQTAVTRHQLFSRGKPSSSKKNVSLYFTF